MIRAELCFKAVGCVAERCGHYSCIGNDHVERFSFCQQPVGAGTHTLQIRKIEFNQFEASAIGRGLLSHLFGCSFGFVQISRRAHNLGAVRGQRARRFHAETGRNTGYENSFALQTHAGQNVICGRSCTKWSCLNYVRHFLPPCTDTFDITVHGSGYALTVQRDGFRGVFEIVLRVQIGNESRLNRSPSKLFLRQRAGSRAIRTKEESHPAKMIGCGLARLADDRYVQREADDLSDLPSRDALVGHAVIPCSDGTFLEHEPVEMSSIKPMNRGPTVEPVADKCGNALFACDANQAWHKAVITDAVDGWGKPQYRCTDSACRQRQRRQLRLAR